MLTCGCGRWMHTEGIEERMDGLAPAWFVRFECGGCHSKFGTEAPPDKAMKLVDRLMWTDEARHIVDRLPPYVAPLIRQDAEDYARSKEQRVITFTLLAQARNGGTVAWDPEAERRLDNVPGPVRAMAKVELERTALERGQSKVTIALMDEVKTKYFGMAAKG